MAARAPYAAVPRALMGQQRVTHGAVRLYGVLTRYADQDDLVHTTQRELAEEMGCSAPTIERWVRELREHGWVSVSRERPGGPNVYRINSRPEPDTEGARNAVTNPPAQHRTLIPPIADDGRVPSNMMAPPYRYRKKEENLASRGATLDEDIERAAGSDFDPDFDPEFVAGFQEGREGTAPATGTGARALAMELRSTWMQHGPSPVAGDINVAAVAGQIAQWRKTGVTADEIRAMITLFVSAKGYHIERAAPWRAFLARRKALLDAVRSTATALAAENDPDYWHQGQRTADDDKAEADAWYAAQYAGT